MLVAPACTSSDDNSNQRADGASTTAEATATAEDSSRITRASTTTTQPGVEQELLTEEGWRYRVLIVSQGADPSPSAGGCYDSPPPSQTHLRFKVKVINLIADRPSPPPNVVFGVNMSEDGTLATSADTLEKAAYRKIEVSPQRMDNRCSSFISPTGTSLPAGGTAQYEVLIADVVRPPPDGIKLFVRGFGPQNAYINWQVPFLLD